MEALRVPANRPGDDLNSIRRGWKLGREDFLDWLLQKVELNTAEAHPALAREETEQSRALRIIQKEMHRLSWTRSDLRRRRKGDAIKVALARRLCAETAVTLKWIARTLHAGTSTYLANRLYHCRRSQE